MSQDEGLSYTQLDLTTTMPARTDELNEEELDIPDSANLSQQSFATNMSQVAAVGGHAYDHIKLRAEAAKLVTERIKDKETIRNLKASVLRAKKGYSERSALLSANLHSTQSLIEELIETSTDAQTVRHALDAQSLNTLNKAELDLMTLKSKKNHTEEEKEEMTRLSSIISKHKEDASAKYKKVIDTYEKQQQPNGNAVPSSFFKKTVQEQAHTLNVPPKWLQQFLKSRRICYSIANQNSIRNYFTETASEKVTFHTQTYIYPCARRDSNYNIRTNRVKARLDGNDLGHSFLTQAMLFQMAEAETVRDGELIKCKRCKKDFMYDNKGDLHHHYPYCLRTADPKYTCEFLCNDMSCNNSFRRVQDVKCHPKPKSYTYEQFSQDLESTQEVIERAQQYKRPRTQ